MSKPNEEQDIYYIPPNFLTGGRLFGGMIRARNAIEACVLVLLTGIPIIKLPLSLTARIIILCLIPLPLGIFGVIGFEGDSLSEFAINWIRWLTRRRILYRSDITVPADSAKQSRRMRRQESPDPPEQLGIRIKTPRKRQKRQRKTSVHFQQFRHRLASSRKKQIPHAEDFIPVKDIRNGIIETMDGRYIRIIEVEPINFLLRSTSEQRNIVASFASWMKISPVKVQIKVLTKKADIGKHLRTIERDMESENNPKCRELQLDYAEAYLNDVVESQGKLFDFVAQEYPDKDTEEFINTYMASKARKSIDEAKAYVNTMDAKELWAYFTETENYRLKDGKALEGFMPSWIGEFYAYYQWYYNLPSAELVKKIPVSFLKKAYAGLHDLELDLAVKKVGEA